MPNVKYVKVCWSGRCEYTREETCCNFYHNLLCHRESDSSRSKYEILAITFYMNPYVDLIKLLSGRVD